MEMSEKEKEFHRKNAADMAEYELIKKNHHEMTVGKLIEILKNMDPTYAIRMFLDFNTYAECLEFSEGFMIKEIKENIDDYDSDYIRRKDGEKTYYLISYELR